MDNRGKSAISEKTAYSRMARICSMKECCEFDIRIKIRRYNLEEVGAEDRIIALLKKGKYIDDQRYVDSFVHDKFQFNKWGKSKIEAALWEKHIPAELIKTAFSEIPKDKWLQSLMLQLENKYKSISFQSEIEAKTKLLRYAAGRGYGYEESLRCIEELLRKKNK
ncbi:MAG: regulatory protein RecX [Dysgonamonadaceae bacterium]